MINFIILYLLHYTINICINGNRKNSCTQGIEADLSNLKTFGQLHFTTRKPTKLAPREVGQIGGIASFLNNCYDV